MQDKFSSGYEGRKSETSTVGEAMHELLNTYRLKAKFEQAQLINSWERLMGEPIARRTDKIYISNRKLYVKLKSASLKQELTMSKSKILAIFMKEFGEVIVDDVIFL